MKGSKTETRGAVGFLEALRTGGGPILSPASADALGTHAICDLRAWTEGEGWGFGLGAARS